MAKMAQLGFQTIAITGGTNELTQDQQQKIREGWYTHVFMTIEQFAKPEFHKMLASLYDCEGSWICLIVDEAHVVDEWEGIKPDYRVIGRNRIHFEAIRILLASATVTWQQEKWICRHLQTNHIKQSESSLVIRGKCDRPNITYCAQQWPVDKPLVWCDSALEDTIDTGAFWGSDSTAAYGLPFQWQTPTKIPGKEFTKANGTAPKLFRKIAHDLRTAIRENTLKDFPRVVIFCRTYSRVIQVHEFLSQALTEVRGGLPDDKQPQHYLSMYCSGIVDEADKRLILRSLLDPDGLMKVVVCTKAFGLGVDICNIKVIIHYGAPSTKAAYVQEAGRGGRDGLPAVAILLWCRRDFLMCDLAMKAFCLAQNGCKRLSIIKHFAAEKHEEKFDELKPTSPCCDVCTKVTISDTSDESDDETESDYDSDDSYEGSDDEFQDFFGIGARC
jgi:superfamily II DNA helicase RecQ